jgi:hypothetical protein
LGLKLGEKKWGQVVKEKWKHPDPQKTICFHEGALIYSALWPEKTHKDFRPPLDWMKEAGITEASLSEARKQLELADPDWSAKRAFREAIWDDMDNQ